MQARIDAMEDFRSIVARYPQRELEIRRLRARDAGFRAVCRDYEEAVSALRHWQTVAADVGARVEEYADFVAELEAEILDQLDRPASAAQRR